MAYVSIENSITILLELDFYICRITQIDRKLTKGLVSSMQQWYNDMTFTSVHLVRLVFEFLLLRRVGLE